MKFSQIKPGVEQFIRNLFDDFDITGDMLLLQHYIILQQVNE